MNNRILLIGDMPGWAFDNIIQFIKKHISGYEFYFDYTIYHPRIDKIVTTDIKDSEKNNIIHQTFIKKRHLQNIPVIRGIQYRILKKLNEWGYTDVDADGRKCRIRGGNQYDLVVFLDYYMDKDADFSHIKANKIIKGIYTAGFPPKGILINSEMSIDMFCKEYLDDADAIVCGSPSIADTYRPYTENPVFFANMAYNEQVFSPKKKPRHKDQFILGWTGNPNREFKGFHTIIIPAIEKLNADGYNVGLRTQFEGKLESLADFWQDVDLAVIASEADAGPSLFMEASLCGVPSVSTRIGMPEYVIEDGKNGLFCERTIDDLTEKIKLLIKDRKLLEKMQKNIRNDYIRKLGVEVQKKNWEVLFRTILSDE